MKVTLSDISILEKAINNIVINEQLCLPQELTITIHNYGVGVRIELEEPKTECDKCGEIL